MIAGIDYSMTSPAVCCYDNIQYKFYYLTTKKKLEGTFESGNMFFEGTNADHVGSDDVARFDIISQWTVNILKRNNVQMVMLEDYSFASTGRTFQIGENTGLLKYKLNCSKIPFKTVPPTVLKKFATGKGNANKELLNDTFKQSVGVDIKLLLQQSDKQWNPSSDLIDAYYLAQYCIKETK